MCFLEIDAFAGQFHDRFTSSFCRPLPLLVVPSDHETPSAVRWLSNKDRNSNTENGHGERQVSSGSLEFETMKGRLALGRAQARAV